MFATWTFISIGRRVTQVSKCAFNCAVNRFCSSRAKKIHLKFMIFNYRMLPSTHPFLFSSRSLGAKALLATPWPQTPTRHHHDAMSSCKPKSTFFCTLAGFSCAAWTLVFIFELFPCTNHLLYLRNTRQERYHTPHLP